MITREYRRLTDSEVNDLQTGCQWLRFKMTDVLGILFITVVLYVGGGWCLGSVLDWVLFTALVPNGGTYFLSMLLPGLGLILALTQVVLGERSRRVAYARSEELLQETLADGRAEIIRCTVDRVVELKEYEDEGPGYFLSIGPDLMLFLQGQYLMEFDNFPSAEVTMVRVAKTQLVLDVTYSGDQLVVARRMEAWQYGGADWLRNGLIFRGNVDEISEAVINGPPRNDALNEVLREKDS